MKTILLSAWLLLPVITFCQDSLKINRPIFVSGLATYDFPRGYGFAIGTSIPFHSFKGKADKDFKTPNSEKLGFISAESGGYRNPFAYTAIVANAGIGIRYIKSAKHFTELSFNQGILRTAYDGKVYELDKDGNIKERVLFGRTYLTTGFFYSLNWNLDNGISNLWFIQVKPGIWMQYPYNSFLRPHFSIQAGISYRLKNIALHTPTKHRHLS
jgi:hypothetical protein